MTTKKTDDSRELLARKKLHEIAAEKAAAKKEKTMSKGIPETYAACRLQKVCTLDNFNKIYRGNIRIPNWRIIWTLRNIINPAEWFFHEDEKPKKEDLVDTSPSILPDFRESVNFARIKEKTGTRGRDTDITNWCERVGIKYITLYMIRSEQRPITTSFVFKMRKIFPPRLWFEKEKPHDNNNHPDSK